MDMQGVLQSQYLAAVKMLREAVVKCPASVWDASQDKDKFWFKAQHSLYWTHRNLQAFDRRFIPWKGHRKPDAGSPVSRQEILQYLAFIQKQLVENKAATDFRNPRSGKPDPGKLETAIASIRHIQQHTGELYERLGTRENISLNWTEQVHRKTQ
jgi:hypothetical protein